MYLFIDALSSQAFLLLLFNKQLKIVAQKKYSSKGERFLLLINRFLKLNKVSLKQIKGILVVRGPGSFSQIRAILSIVNTINFVLNIPVKGLKAPYTLEEVKNHILKFKNQKKSQAKLVLPYYG
jgi:tRNA A37 threonylcarbamoyladenosine modification protein TsaB